MSLRSGVERSFGADTERLDQLSAEGWTVHTLVADGDRHGVLAAIGRSLDLPDWYGANLDALWDCLHDLERPTALVWHGWHEMLRSHPGDFAKVLLVLTDWVGSEERSEPFQVLLA